ncbi:hypothetical protein [Sphingomonas sp. DBB INV C78]|uniref:hypothetical protein n=1 Tax=Sphingomonas sp. DBB INV C78 TaxID=3349434 RepID=UPI0036D26FA7
MLGLAIQERLITLISNAERRITARRGKTKRAKQELANRVSKDEASRRKAEIGRASDAIGRDKALIGLCRDIGDSIAFLYADRWDIKPLAQKEPPGDITNKKGARLERAILRRLYNDGHSAVLNDLTGSLRHGDVTAFNRAGYFHIIEAKSGSGGNRHRAARQQVNAQAILDYLARDEGVIMGQPLIRRSVGERLIYHVRAINRLFSLLKAHGEEAMREVEPGVFYCLLTDNPSGELIDKLSRPEGPVISLFANDAKRQGLGYFPFPLIFDDPAHTLDFYLGRVVILISIDLYKVARLSGAALRAEPGQNLDTPLIVFPPKELGPSVPEYLAIGSHLFGRVGAEFLSPRSLIRMSEHRALLIAADDLASSNQSSPNEGQVLGTSLDIGNV